MVEIVCLYSKYSEQCVLFFEDMAYLKGVRMLCIDNDAVRRQIEEDSCQFDITVVPCILVFHNSGRMDKFEGQDAFSWLHDRRQKMMLSSKLIMSSIMTEPVAPVIQAVPPPPQQAPHQPSPHVAPALPPPAEEERTPGDPVLVDVPESERSATESGSGSILKKKENIMNLAMSMAKQRESEFEANDPKKKIQQQQ